MTQTSTLVDQSVEFATRAHEGQRQEADCSPFISHPLQVAELLRDRGLPDEVLAAAVLHDVVENTDVELGEIRRRFGDRVAELVRALSEDPEIEDYGERKADLRGRIVAAGPEAAAIFAADKVSKLRELRSGLRQDPDGFSARVGDSLERRLDHHEATLRELSEAPYEVPLLDELEHELSAFREELAAARARGGSA
jgi:(p)ppGpp synthase/HD superfamily hydrolase